MDSPRDTIILKVGNKDVVVKSYSTARENSLIQQAVFKGAKVELIGEQPKITDFNLNAQHELKLEMIRQMVVSFDGSTEDIINRCENILPNEEFVDLVEQLDKIVSKKKS